MIFLLILLSLSCINANQNDSLEDLCTNEDIELSDDVNIEKSSDDTNKLKSSSEEDNSDEIQELYLDEDCCSNIVQVSENESVISFRRDTLSSAIDIKIGNNSTHVYQYKTAGSYFCHIIVSNDGWLFGTGGASGAYIHEINNKALSMMKANKITTSDLNYIAKLHKNSGFGHFLIKAPDGRYGVEICRSGLLIKTGTLKSGEFIVSPNSIPNYKKGNYVTYTKTSDPVKASRLIALKDKYGIYRRNVMTYHFRNNITESRVDFYVCNDDGSRVGVSSSRYCDNIVTSTKRISHKNIPTSVNGLYVSSYVFKHPKPEISFNVSSNKNVSVMGDNITFTARLTYDKKTVNEGFVIFKINGITIKDSNQQPIKCYLKNGKANITYTIPDGWSAKTFKITAVYSKSYFGRIENKSYFDLRRSDIHMDIAPVKSSNNTIYIEGKILDEFNHSVKGQNVLSIKVDGLTIKTWKNDTRYFVIREGVMHFYIDLPDIYKKGNHTITITAGTRAGYNSYRQDFAMELL